MKTALRHCLLAEALGTALLLVFGTGAAVVNEQTHALGHGGIAAAFGLVVFMLIQSLGPTSGAHVNPAVTLDFWIAGRLPGRRVAPLRVTSGAYEQGLLAGLTISPTVGLEALVGGPLSGASINPACSLALALVSGHLAAGWVYIVGPMAGVVLAVLVDRLLELRPVADGSAKL